VTLMYTNIHRFTDLSFADSRDEIQYVGHESLGLHLKLQEA